MKNALLTNLKLVVAASGCLQLSDMVHAQVKNHFPNDGLPKKDLFGGTPKPSPSLAPSYPTGGGIKNHFPNDGLPKKDLFGGTPKPSPSLTPSYPTDGGVKNHFPNDGLPKKDLFEGNSTSQSSFDHTYNFGGGNTLRSTYSLNPQSGAISTGLESSWANGNRNRYDTSTRVDGSQSSRSDNTYNFGGGNTIRSARSYDSATGASETDSTQTWGNGSSTRSISGRDAEGRSYNYQANTYNWGNGKTSTTITGRDADGNYVSKTITR